MKDLLKRNITGNVILDLIFTCIFVLFVIWLFFMCSSCNKNNNDIVPKVKFQITVDKILYYNNFNLQLIKNNSVVLYTNCKDYQDEITLQKGDTLKIQCLNLKEEVVLGIKNMNNDKNITYLYFSNKDKELSKTVICTCTGPKLFEIK